MAASADQRPLRILQVIAGAAVGGAETFAQDAIVALHGRGVVQQVLTRPHPAVLRRYAQAGVAAEGMGFSVIDRALGRGRRIRSAALDLGADLVHAWMSRANAFIPADMPCPVIGWFGDYYDLKYFRRADFWFCVTPDIARYVIGKGARPHRVFTVNTFGTMPDSQPVPRESLDTPADATVLLVLSRMHTVKGIDTMLRALVLLPGVVLWLAGDGPEMANYQALAGELGLRDRVRFLGWRGDRKSLLEACDICVLPSRYEPFGTVIVEAWAMRRPLVATSADGARQYVTDGRTGLLCPIEDPPALAGQIRRLIDDPGLRRAIAEAGHAAYLADFTRDIVTERLLEAYATCVRLGKLGNDRTVRRPAAADAAEAVRLAYAPFGPAMAAEAAGLQAGGRCSLLLPGGRVLLLDSAQLDRACGFFRESGGLEPADEGLRGI